MNPNVVKGSICEISNYIWEDKTFFYLPIYTRKSTVELIKQNRKTLISRDNTRENWRKYRHQQLHSVTGWCSSEGQIILVTVHQQR